MKKLLLYTSVIIVSGFIFIFAVLYNLAPRGEKPYSTYSFPNSKHYLENKIDSLIDFDEKIIRKVVDIDATSEFYNTGNYFTIKIDSLEYTFRYIGDSIIWKNATNISKIHLVSINSLRNKELSNAEKLKIVEEQFIKKLKINFTK